MELRQLTTFVTIAKWGSFIQAAERLGYAQSSITNHIQSLERELGVKLFERLGHRVMLTTQGRFLLPYAEQMTRLAAEVLEATNANGARGKLIIGTNESLGAYRLPELLRLYRRQYPQVELAVKFANCDGICQLLKDNEIDVGIILNQGVDAADFVIESLAPEKMLFLAAADHPFSCYEKISPQNLRETAIIMTEPGCSYRLTLEKIIKEFKVVPQSLLEASSIETIKQLLILGLGISLLPRFAVERELGEGILRELEWTGPLPEYWVQLLYHKDKWISPTIQTFLAAAKENLFRR